MVPMPLYIFARLDPRPGKELQVRDELTRVLGPTRAEPGCVRIHVYEGVRDPLAYFIHSEWIDEAAFDAHVELPHTRQFVAAVEGLLTNPLQAVRTKQFG
jgi:quinol monooxygenase YgiN